MRIALDTTYAAGSALTGVGVYSREITHALARAHPESLFICCYRPHRFFRAFREQLPPNCRRRPMHEPLVSRAALFHGLNQRLPRVRLKAAVTTFHDLFVITGDYSEPEFRRRFEALARDAAARSDLIIAVSQFTAGQVEQLLGVPRERIRVVPHGVLMPASPPGVNAREKLVLHVGAIQKRKNVARLVRAFEAMPPGWRLALAGSFGFGAAECLQAIESSPRRDSIDVLGYVDADTLARLYSRAAILAYPSCAEGFGIPLLEAMAWGVPVVTSTGTALSEVAGEAALAVDPGDTQALSAALVRLAEDTNLRSTLAAMGRTRAAGFTWERAARETWAAYEEVLAL
jgi:glycosyltransferase involved in cell wall biosynthesis